jgi:hypothetical protein
MGATLVIKWFLLQVILTQKNRYLRSIELFGHGEVLDGLRK